MNDNIGILMEDMIKVRKTFGGDTLSVEEVLNIPSLSGYRILGGEKGLKNRCKHITILETPTGISWLEGEEFLLTAGYAFYYDEERKKNMLHDAKKKGVSAIAIKENRYFGEVSKELIDQANEYSIPLILIPYEVVYTKTVSDFYDMLFFRKNEYILRLNMIYEKLMELSFENRDIDGIIHSLSTITNLSIILVDQNFKPLSTSILADDLGGITIDSSSLNNIISDINYKSVEPKINIRFNEFHISIYPLFGDDKKSNHIFIIGNSKMDRLSQSTVEYGASIISAKLERDRSTRISQTRFNKTLVEMMLNNKELPDEFYDNVNRELSWNENNPYVGLCIRINLVKDEDIEDNKNEIYKAINQLMGKYSYLYIDKKSYIFLFINVSSHHYIEDFIYQLMEFTEKIKDRLTVSIGVSNQYRELKDIKKLYEESYMAILFSNKDIVYYRSLDIIRLLYPLKDGSEIQEYYASTIKKIENYDEVNGTSLMDTLEIFFRYDNKKTVVASKLFIHVETLRYRLNRIEEITGYSLDTSEGIFALQMGLKLKKLIKLH